MDNFDRYSDGQHDDPFEEDEAAFLKEDVDDDPSAFTPERYAFDEESSSELTADDANTNIAETEDGDGDLTKVNSAYGWVALALSIVSFFWMPVVLGAAGVIVGFIARSRGANTLGMTAIVAGAASIIISLFIFPFV